MPVPVIRALSLSEQTSAIDTIVLAFSADPIARWTWPDSRRYLASMPLLVTAFGGRAFDHGSAIGSEGVRGAALWLPPGVKPDEEAMGALVEQTVEPSLADEMNAFFEQMARFHPTEPHWYLPLIGVDPAFHGRGHGDALMTYALERCDRDHLPAYLESTNPRNITLYRRHGFEALGAIQAGSSPQMVPMLRAAR